MLDPASLEEVFVTLMNWPQIAATPAKPEDLAAFQSAYDEVGKALNEVNATTRERADLRSQAFDLVAAWRSERVARLSVLDFVYFSLGVATTTTFGDIVPNHPLTRFIVTLQLLISIVLVGLFVNSLSSESARGLPNTALPAQGEDSIDPTRW